MQAVTSNTTSKVHANEQPAIAEDPRVARIVARSIFRDMKANGIPQSRILEVASELIGLVTSDLSATNRRS
ncbi:MAG: hypothetical protein KTR25_07655 [Myxococcales bacterium]|nr:hypothetical protein [Myxococcales bacterium]